jgi:hypothetical protein
VTSTTVEGRPVVDGEVRGVRDPRGNVEELARGGLPAEVCRGLEEGAHRPRQRTADQTYAEPFGILATGKRVAALGVCDDQGDRAR